MRKRNYSLVKLIFGGIGILFLIGLFVLYNNNVDNTLTQEDAFYISKILGQNEVPVLPNDPNYEQEINFIKKAQQAVLKVAPQNKGLPEGTPREPKQLYSYHYGLCYDRSRAIEKILRVNGFTTRHISVYSLRTNTNPMKAFFSVGNESHAISEVKTSKGWMFIDSNDRFLGLDKNNTPISIDALQEEGFQNINWAPFNNMNYQVIYKDEFTYLYGLYSRHGQFYEPYTFIPDLNWDEFLQNF